MSGKVGPLTILIVLIIFGLYFKNFIDANYPSETMVAGHYQEIGENINRYLEEININNPNERELNDEYKKIYKKIQIIDNNEYKRFYNSELVAKQRKDLLVICDRLLTEIKDRIQSNDREVKTRKDLDILYQKIQSLNNSIENTLKEYKEKIRQIPLINKNDQKRLKDLEDVSITIQKKTRINNKKEDTSDFVIFWYQKPINLIYFFLLIFLILFVYLYYFLNIHKKKHNALKEYESYILKEKLENEHTAKQIESIIIEKEEQMIKKFMEDFSTREEIIVQKEIEIDNREKEIELKQKNLEERDKCSIKLSEKINKTRNVYLNKIDVAKFEKNNLLELCKININRVTKSLEDKNLPFDIKEKELNDELKEVLKRRPENWEPRPE